MKLKRFFAPDMRQAMSLVRAQLGPDAVIVGNKTTTEGVEIVVALEGEDDIRDENSVATSVTNNSTEKNERVISPRARTRSANAYATDSASEMGAIHTATPIRPPIKQKKDSTAAKDGIRDEHFDPLVKNSNNEILAEQYQALEHIKSELQSLRSMIQTKISTNGASSAVREDPEKQELLKNLLEMSISPQLIRRIIGSVSKRGAEPLMLQAITQIARWLSIYPGDLLDNGGIVALVGPTGVGKTTTVAKLAAKFVMRHGKNQLALINMDNYRIGAYENLKIYGRILGVPARNVTSHTELRQVIQENYDKKLILLDTAGVGQRDGRVDEVSNIFNDESSGIKTCLVLSANVGSAVLRETIQRFHPRRLSGVILTKLDEANSLGAVLSELIAQRLPVAYVADGQRVPEDIHRVESTNLVEYMLSLWKQNKQWVESEAVELMANGFSNFAEER